jgi:hypothetical protein
MWEQGPSQLAVYGTSWCLARVRLFDLYIFLWGQLKHGANIILIWKKRKMSWKFYNLSFQREAVQSGSSASVGGEKSQVSEMWLCSTYAQAASASARRTPMSLPGGWGKVFSPQRSHLLSSSR